MLTFMQSRILDLQPEEVGINHDQALSANGVKFVLVSLNVFLDSGPLRADGSSDCLVEGVEFGSGLIKNGGFPSKGFGEGSNNLVR